MTEPVIEGCSVSDSEWHKVEFKVDNEYEFDLLIVLSWVILHFEPTLHFCIWQILIMPFHQISEVMLLI